MLLGGVEKFAAGVGPARMGPSGLNIGVTGYRSGRLLPRAGPCWQSRYRATLLRVMVEHLLPYKNFGKSLVATAAFFTKS